MARLQHFERYTSTFNLLTDAEIVDNSLYGAIGVSKGEVTLREYTLNRDKLFLSRVDQFAINLHWRMRYFQHYGYVRSPPARSIIQPMETIRIRAALSQSDIKWVHLAGINCFFREWFAMPGSLVR